MTKFTTKHVVKYRIMERTIRQTCNYRLVEDEYFNTSIVDILSGKRTNWNTDPTNIRNEVNLIKHLSDDEFDEYCKKQIMLKS